MNGSAARDRVADLLTPVFAESAIDLEAVELIPAGRRTVVRLVVDADGGVGLDQLADLSRMVGKVLDSHDVMGERAYTLEVTSRGVDRPLTAPRHWRRNVGRLVKVVHLDGSQLTGRVDAADEAGANLAEDGLMHRVDYAEVAKARVQVEFTRSTATDDDSGDGADGAADGTDDKDGEG
ncbi:MAG: ribosome maturation factor RimP [Actinopolymorphaceae bacterium]